MKNLQTFESYINESVSPISRDDMMSKLSKKFPNIWIKKSEAFDPKNTRGIWTGSEGETFVDANKKVAAFNPSSSIFYDESADKNYVSEVHKSLAKLLADNGWYTESYDPATFFFYPVGDKK